MEGESFSAGKSVSDKTQEFNVPGSSNIGSIHSTQEARDKDSDSDSESHVPVRRSKKGILVLHPLDMELLFPIKLLYVQLLVGY